MENYFQRLSQIDVSAHVEKKGGFSYLSWPFAVAQLRLADPTALWEVRRFDGLPYLRTENGTLVEVAVTVQGITLSQIHPVLDHRNRPIAEPSVFDLNTSLQRALVKAIALHGLGLSLYAGEDLPTGSETETPVKAANVQAAPVNPMLSEMQQREIRAELLRVNGSLSRLLAYFKAKSLAEIPASDFDRVMRALNRGRRAA